MSADVRNSLMKKTLADWKTKYDYPWHDGALEIHDVEKALETCFAKGFDCGWSESQNIMDQAFGKSAAIHAKNVLKDKTKVKKIKTEVEVVKPQGTVEK